MRVVTAEYRRDGKAIRSIRMEVFVGEQKIDPSLEIDGLDPNCKHVLCYINETPVGTGRIQIDGHIGRLAVLKKFRGRGVGRDMMKHLIARAKDLGCEKAWLSSQCHATGFYEELGFEPQGEVYQEAGIDHIKMEMRLR